MKQHFLDLKSLCMLLLRLIPAETEESWELSAALEAVLWLSDYPCVPPASHSSPTSSLGLIVNRSWLLSDLLWWWYRLSAVPPLHLHSASFLWSVTVSKCARVVHKHSLAPLRPLRTGSMLKRVHEQMQNTDSFKLKTSHRCWISLLYEKGEFTLKSSKSWPWDTLSDLL